MKKTLIVLVAILALVCSFAIAEEACDHNWNPHKIASATCTSAEKWEETCSKCGESNGTYTVGSALGHNYVETKISDATCDAAATYKKECTNGCGESTTFTKGSALEHNYVETVKKGDCKTKAVITGKCTLCGDTYTKEGALGEHNWEVLKDNKVCDTITYTEKCTICGEINQVWSEDSGKNHNWEVEITVADCTNAKTYTETCSKCGVHNQTWTEGEALGHTESIVKGYPATCTATGLTDKIVCSVCNAVIKDHEVIPMIPHTEVVIPATASTCIEHGRTEGKKCSVCNAVLDAGTELPYAAHDYEKNRVVEPTETKRGYTEYKCTVCGDWYRARYTSALGVAADAALAPYGEGIVTDLDDVAMPYTAEIDEEIGRVIITATDKGVLRELHISLALVEQWKAEGLVEVEFIVDEAEIVVPFAVLETEVMAEVKAAFPATLTGYIVTLDPTAVNEAGEAGVLVKVDLTADTAEEDGIEMEVTDAIEGMKLAIGDAVAASVVGGGVYVA